MPKNSVITPIKKTSKPAPVVETQEETVSPTLEIPKDLQEKVSAINQVATCFEIIQKAYLPYSFRNSIGQSLAFLEKLYGNVVKDAMNHPQAHLVPELKEVLKAEAGVQDGKKN